MLRETFCIPLDGFIENLCFNAVQFCKIFIKHHPHTADFMNFLLYYLKFHRS